jgi:hypothetical protein
LGPSRAFYRYGALGGAAALTVLAIIALVLSR